MAGVDARIPLSFQPAQFELPSEVAMRQRSLANLGQRNVMQDQQIRAENMRVEEDQRMREQARQSQALIADQNLTPEEKIQRAYEINPVFGEKLENNYRERLKFQQAQQDRNAKIAENFNGAVGPVVASLLEVPDEKVPDSYKTERARLGEHPWIKNTEEGQALYKSLPQEATAEQIRQFAAQYAPGAFQQFNQRKLNADKEKRAQDTANANAKRAQSAIDAANTRNADNIKSREKIAGMRDRAGRGGSGGGAAGGRLADQRKVKALAARAIRDSRAGGGTTLEHVRQNVLTAYEDDPDFDLYRADVLAEIMKLQAAEKKASGKTGSSIQGLKERIGAKGGGGAAPAKKGKLTDSAVAQEYLQKAGGDKEKARQLAKSDGWEL